MNSRQVIKLLKSDEWQEVNHVGSHKLLKHPAKAGRVLIAAEKLTSGRNNDECRQPTGLTDHFALIAPAAFAFVCESRYTCENRIGIEMRFGNHFRFEASASPGIVEVGGE